jgi:UDP-glucuronate decarboxylase
VARIFNTYGPRMRADDGRVVSSLITQALAGDDVTVYGDGKQTRSFCYVDDLANGLISLMTHGYSGVVNLGNPRELRIRDLASLVVAMTGTRSTIAFRPLPVDDPPRRRPDISLARRVLGWTPKIPLEAGLKETIAHFMDEALAAARLGLAPVGQSTEAAPRKRRTQTLASGAFTR